MARFLSWKHLSRDQLVALRGAQAAPSARDVLRECLGTSTSSAVEAEAEEQQQRQDIILDLFSYTLKQGQAWGFDDERLSVLFGLVKEVHDASVSQRLTVERSFAFFKETLLNHSVHRPPFSCGVFSQAEMQAVLDWMLNTYYRHYKLYQYAFTKRVTLSITTYHPSSLVEVPPVFLPPLADAVTEQQHQQELDEQQRQLEEQQRLDAEAAAVAAAEAAARAVQEEYEASLPDDVKAKVAAVLERETAYLKNKMEQQYQAQQAALLARLAQLEMAVASAAPPAGVSGSSSSTPRPAAVSAALKG